MAIKNHALLALFLFIHSSAPAFAAPRNPICREALGELHELGLLSYEPKEYVFVRHGAEHGTFEALSRTMRPLRARSNRRIVQDLASYTVNSVSGFRPLEFSIERHFHANGDASHNRYSAVITAAWATGSDEGISQREFIRRARSWGGFKRFRTRWGGGVQFTNEAAGVEIAYWSHEGLSYVDIMTRSEPQYNRLSNVIGSRLRYMVHLFEDLTGRSLGGEALLQDVITAALRADQVPATEAQARR